MFWRDGFAATSLDDLSAATGMNRPSLYGASATSASSTSRATRATATAPAPRMVEIFTVELPMRERLERIYAIALDMYLSGEDGPRGCFTVMTATSEAVSDPTSAPCA